MALSSAQKQAAFLARKAELGLKSVTVLIPTDCEADLRVIARFMQDNPGCKFGMLRNAAGKQVNPFKTPGTTGRKAMRAKAAAIRAAKQNTVRGGVVA